MFDDIKNLDYKICPICKGQLAVGLGGYYKHITPSSRCGYYEQISDEIFAQALKEQSKQSQEQ